MLATLEQTAHLISRLSPETQVAVLGLVDRISLLKNWDDFMDARGLSVATRRGYRYWVLRFVADTLLPLEVTTEDDVVDYLASLPRKGEARGQVLRALRSFYSWALEREQVLVNPVKRLKVPRHKYGPAPFLTEEELTQILVAAAWREERRAWAILLAYATGARVGSLCAVRADDVHAGWLKFTSAKGNRPYSVPLSKLGLAAIKGLMTCPRPPRAGPNKRGTLLGIGPTQFHSWVQEAGEDAGVKAWPHLLRHSFATHILERSPMTDVRVLQEALNHADLSQIARYTGVRNDRLKAAFEALG